MGPGPNGGYAWSGFQGFLAAYDAASEFIRTAQNYRDLIYAYLASAAEEGAIYVEVFTSVDHASRVGISYGDLLAALVQGIDDAEAEFGIDDNPVTVYPQYRRCSGHTALAMDDGPIQQESMFKLIFV